MKISADLHIHSTLSPCGSLEMSPRAIVNRAKELNLDVIAITDHNSVENSFYAASIGKKLGIKVVFGMEAQTAEDVHILCYFGIKRDSEKFYSDIYNYLPVIKNNPEYFGDQIVVDENDNIVRIEEKLLLNSLDLSISELVDRVRSCNGYVVPAHIESEQFGLMINLGFVPEELNNCMFEISYNANRENILDKYPELGNFNLISNSDAHYIRDIGRAYTIYDVKTPVIEEICEAGLKGRFNVK